MRWFRGGSRHEGNRICHVRISRGYESLGLGNRRNEDWSLTKSRWRQRLDTRLVSLHWLLLYLRLPVVHHNHSCRHRGALVRLSLVEGGLNLPGLSLSLSSEVFFTDGTVTGKLLLLLQLLVLPLVTPLVSAGVVLATMVLHAYLGGRAPVSAA